MIASSQDGKVYLVDARHRSIINEFSGLSCNKHTVAKHPKDTVLVSVASDGSIKAFDIRSSVPVFSIKRRCPVTAISFSPSGDSLFVGNTEGIIEELEFNRLLEYEQKPSLPTIKRFDQAIAEKKVILTTDRASASLSHLQNDLEV